MIYKIFSYISSAVLFCLAAGLIVIYATGYQIDLTNKSLLPTSTLEIQSRDADAQIYIDDELAGSGHVVKRGLKADLYNVEVKKEGYHSWQKSVNLIAGQAEVISDIVLFSMQPKIEEYTLKDSTQSITEMADVYNLVNSNGEIYQDDTLITRFSDKVTGLCRYSTRYIAFTQNKKLKIMDTNGTNLTEILDKDSDTPVVFVNSGKSVIYENGGKVYRALIR